MSELIDNIVDVPKVSKEFDEVNAMIEVLKGNITTLQSGIRANKSFEDLAKSTKVLNDAIVEGSGAVDKYVSIQQELDKQKKQSIALDEKRLTINSKDAADIEKKKKLLKEEQELIKLQIIMNNKEAGTLEKAEAYTKILQMEKRKLNLTTKEGIERLKEINIQQDKNNDLVKNSSNKLQEQKIGIGNYRDGFSTLTNQFKNGEIGLKGLTTGFFQMGKATLAALWPVGLVVAAIGTLYAVFKNFAPLIDKIEQGFAGLTAAWSVLKNSLGQFLSGNQSLKESMGGLGGAMKQAATDAASLKKAEQDLADATGGLEVANKKIETQMQQLLLQSKNKTLSEKEQMALIDQAIALEDQQFKNKKKINDEELRISYENIRVKNKLNADQYAKLKELGVDYVEELRDQGVQISDADGDRLKAAILANEDIEQQKIAIVEKAMNRKDALQEKAAAAAEKAAEKAAAAAEKAAKEEEEREKKLLELKRKLKDTELQLMDDGEEKQIAISQENLKRQIEDLTANGQLTAELQANLEAINQKDLQKIRDDFAKQKKDKEAQDLDTLLANYEKGIKKQTDLLSASYKQQESDLKKQYANGKISKQQYDEQLIALQSKAVKEANDITIASLQKQLDENIVTDEKRAELSAKLRDLQIDNENAVTDAAIKANESKIQSDKDNFDKRVQIATDLANAGMELFSAIGDYQAQQAETRIAELDAQQAKSDELYEMQNSNLEKAIMSDARREEAQKKIDTEKAKRDKEIADKKQKEEIRAAKWEKAQALTSAIINTALAEIKMFADAGPLGVVLAALSTAAGLASIATIASQPLPAYAEGGVTGSGLALWGEVRPEVAVTPSGQIMYAENPTVQNFDAGTRIFKSVEEFEKNISMSNGQNKGFEFDYEEMGRHIPTSNFLFDSNGIHTHFDKQGNRIAQINRRTKIGN